MPGLFDQREAEHFLATHWQQSPAFLPAALTAAPQIDNWRAHAASDHGECRRVVTTAPGDYRLEHGPFDNGDPSAPWTVLIQDADHHWPALKALIHAVDFLPRWRVEDVMMSIATPGASVGPHVDAYDVFLVQAAGQRRWEVGQRGDYQIDERTQDLRLVHPFDATDTFTAGPGDVLYLPPDVPHHGIALDDCVTYSIGFRAPTLHDLAAVALGELPSHVRYRDAGATRATDPTLIDANTLTRLRRQMRQFLELDDATLAAALGELMTEPKPWLIDEAAPTPALHPTAAPVQVALVRGARLARFAARGNAYLFANGQAYAIDSEVDAQWLTELAANGHATCPARADSQTLAQALLDDHVIALQA